jgi:hypothetical protein
MFAHPGYDGNSVLRAAHNGKCKEEYSNCKVPAFNSAKGRWKWAFMNELSTKLNYVLVRKL